MQIIEVKTEKDRKDFLLVPLDIYKNISDWIRPLDKDIKEVFDSKRNKFFRHGECTRWLLKDDSAKTIGRVAAFINKKLYFNSGKEIKHAEQMAYHFTMASRLNPGNPEIEFNTGLACFYLHDWNKSSALFETALKNKYLSAESRQAAEKYLKECNQ